MPFEPSIELRFHREHVWVRPIGERPDEAYIGISDFAQKQLGKVLYVELPRVGAQIRSGKPFGAIESHKVVSDLIGPVAADVIEVNQKLKSAAGLVNEDCYGHGWLARIRFHDSSECNALLSADAYASLFGRRER